jgi:mono/diheme cytochrome c family protein
MNRLASKQNFEKQSGSQPVESEKRKVAFRACWLGLLVLFGAGLVFSCRREASKTQAVVAQVQSQTPVLTSLADSVQLPASFGFGRPATEAEIAALDIDVRPDGRGLPAGSGNVMTGKLIYAAKCAMCHGKTGIEGPNVRLVGPALEKLPAGTVPTKEKTIGNYWPYATTLYDYINRAMPFNAPGSLSAGEVYSLTAFLLQANQIIDSTDVMNAQVLPRVVMPAQKLFVPDDRKGGAEVR